MSHSTITMRSGLRRKLRALEAALERFGEEHASAIFLAAGFFAGCLLGEGFAPRLALVAVWSALLARAAADRLTATGSLFMPAGLVASVVVLALTDPAPYVPPPDLADRFETRSEPLLFYLYQALFALLAYLALGERIAEDTLAILRGCRRGGRP